MTVRALFTLAFPSTKIGFTGVGYTASAGGLIILPEDHDRDATRRADEMIVLEALLNTSCLCNNATLTESTGCNMAEGRTGSALSGQPTELALLVAAMKANVGDPRPQYHRLQEVPFSSDRKRMEVKARPVNGVHACEAFRIASSQSSTVDGLYFVKGMPEKVLGECQTYCAANGGANALLEEDRVLTLTQSRRMAATGLRVIAVAYGPSINNLVFAGLCAMEDPPREGVSDCVVRLRRGGVKVMMVTGDSKETALAIAHRCGILGGIEPNISEPVSDELLPLSARDTPFDYDVKPRADLELGVCSEAISGAEIDSISTSNLADSIGGVKVFYRVAPRHKLAIVRACKSFELYPRMF